MAPKRTCTCSNANEQSCRGPLLLYRDVRDPTDEPWESLSQNTPKAHHQTLRTCGDYMETTAHK